MSLRRWTIITRIAGNPWEQIQFRFLFRRSAEEFRLYLILASAGNQREFEITKVRNLGVGDATILAIEHGLEMDGFHLNGGNHLLYKTRGDGRL